MVTLIGGVRSSTDARSDVIVREMRLLPVARLIARAPEIFPAGVFASVALGFPDPLTDDRSAPLFTLDIERFSAPFGRGREEFAIRLHGELFSALVQEGNRQIAQRIVVIRGVGGPIIKPTELRGHFRENRGEFRR